eukprot:scaffold18676_cov79-Isochrysis_galbana.AAC.1
MGGGGCDGSGGTPSSRGGITPVRDCPPAPTRLPPRLPIRLASPGAQVYTHFINKVSASSSTARQLDLAFAALNPNHSGSATRKELHAALAHMSTAPLDEERVDEILTELEDAKEGGKITVASFTAWMARRYRPAHAHRSPIVEHVPLIP